MPVRLSRRDLFPEKFSTIILKWSQPCSHTLPDGSNIRDYVDSIVNSVNMNTDDQNGYVPKLSEPLSNWDRSRYRIEISKP